MNIRVLIRSNVVGYGYFQVPNGFSCWSPVFKNVDGTKVDLVDLTPCQTNMTVIAANNKVMIFKLNTNNTYGDTYSWYGTKSGWSKDNGATIVARGEVDFSVGEGFAMQNLLTEGSGRSAKNVPATFKVAGEVDLVCKNICPSGFSINGNSSPVAIDLVDFVPAATNGVTVAANNKVMIFKLKTDNTYDSTYSWYGTQSGWTKDNGATFAAKGEVTFNPGEGFAMQNLLTEGSGRSAKNVPVLMTYKSPISE